MAMIAITTNNSMSVNPPLSRFLALFMAGPPQEERYDDTSVVGSDVPRPTAEGRRAATLRLSASIRVVARRVF
jgi:hypothetical protein